MPMPQSTTAPRQILSRGGLRYSPAAYHFLLMALRRTQERLGRIAGTGEPDESAHISGQELCDGLRELAAEQFGMLSPDVFRHWGIRSTTDFGRMVFEMIEHGEMRKTSRDQLSDFDGAFDFRDAFGCDYQIDVAAVFRRGAPART